MLQSSPYILHPTISRILPMRYLLLIITLAFGTALTAQVSTTFILPNLAADNNTEVCLPISVIDFSATIEFGFALQTDKPEDGGALTFSRVQNLNPDLPGFGMEDFDLSTYLPAGLITVNWRTYLDGEDCETAPIVTLDDGAILFEVCYNVSGPIATQHPVRFFNKPDDDPFDGVDDSVDITFNRRNTCNVGGFPGIEQGSVTVGVSPLILTITDEEGIYQPGDTYCVEVVAESGFDNLKGYQFGIQFDNTVLQVISATANTDLPQNSDGGYNLFDGDAFYGVWAPFGDLVESLDPGTSLVTVCFEIIGECRGRTDINIGEIPTSSGGTRPVEANGDGPGLVAIPVVQEGIRLIIDDCNPDGFDVVVDCPDQPVNFGDEGFCVAIRAGDDFENMTDIDYLIKWDPSILEFANIGARNPDLFINIGDDFDDSGVNNGVLSFDWDAVGSQSPSVNEGDLIYEICFNAIGFGGTSSVTIADFRNDIRNTDGPFRGLNPTNCAITIQKPEGVAIRYPSTIGFSSTQQNCFDLEVDGFTDVTSFSIFVTYSAFLFEFDAFTPDVAGVTATMLADGLYRLDYSGAPITLTDGSSLGSFCLLAEDGATPGDCDLLGNGGFIADQVVTTESEGNSVPVEVFNGEACVLFPNGFGITIEDTEGDIGDNFCVPVLAQNFVNIQTANIQFNFDPTLVEFSSINISGSNWPGLNTADFDLSQTGVGIITLNFDSEGAGVSHAGGAVEFRAFSLCFNARNRDECFDLTAEDAATPPTVTDDGDGSIIYQGGEVCLNDRLILISIDAVDASCSDADDGGIRFEVAPRPNNEDVFIRTDNPVRLGNNGSVDGLLPGTTNYVLYNANGTVALEGSIEIGVNQDNAAFANAGEDRTLSCADPQTALINGRDNIGEAYELFIVQGDGTTRNVGGGNVGGGGNVVASVSEPGTYLLEVFSASGCSAIDTVEVLGINRPVAEVPDELIIDCNNETVVLDAAGSSEGGNVSYLWERINGEGTPLDTVGTNAQESTDRGGRYRLTVTFTDLQCSNTAQLIVRDQIILPSSSLPTQVPLNCNGDDVELTTGAAEDGIDYAWTRQGEAAVLSMTSSLSVNETGNYVVELSNPATGCTRMDTVAVVPSSGVPTITAPASGPVSISCNPDTTTLTPIFENVDASTSYFWETMDGRVVVTDVTNPSARVVLPGTYRVFASNGECRDSLDIVVGEAVLPTVDAGEDKEIACEDDAQLTGSATSTTGNDLTFQWTIDGEEVPMGSAETVVVTQPGTYFFTATDAITGCSASDSIVLSAPSGFPTYTLADTIGGLGCSPSTVRIRVETEFADDYDFVWNDPSGSEISTESFASASTSGIHTVTITNRATGCVATDEVFVDDDQSDPPFVAFRRNNIDISCESGPAVIDAEPSVGEGGGRYTYTWSVVSGGEEPSEQGNDTLTVRTAGVYRLTVLDNVTLCEDFRDIEVTDSRVFPEVTAIEGEQLDCDTRETTIGITIADQPNDYTIQWVGPPGVEDIPQQVEMITVTTGGTYNAVVINPATSCVTTVPIRVDDLIDSIASIVIMPADSFDCNNATITLDASDTNLNGTDPSGISWRSFDGNNITPATGSLIVSVDGPGDYELSVTDINGCTVQDTVSVAAALNTPFAQAGDPIEAECGDTPQLDGTGSSPEPGGDIIYAWSAEDGGAFVGRTDVARPSVTGPGTYQLIVTNLNNGCSDTSRTTVTLADQEAAMLPASFTTCEIPTVVEGNLPAGTTGVWTSYNDDGAVFTVDNNRATITELGEGINLVWTLSAAGCPDYSSDSLRVSPEEGPTANDDVLQVIGDDNIGQIDLLLNDQRTGPVEVTLLTEPGFGEITIDLNGNITFESPLGLTSTTTVDYEVCSTVCEGLCDQATLTIRASADGSDPTVFNAFTPNGDGMNDIFVFDILNLRPDEFPDNELIIFNRWGDILYEAKPYNNDWDGTSNGGTPVPEGTYYYILRLNVGEGEIIRGDVTVVR